MLTVDEVARATGRNPETLRRWLREGRLSGVKAQGGDWLLPADSLVMLDSIPRQNRRRPALAAA